jgi:heme/copper-type cytochrome/quinol oxidase subunit 2
VAGTGAPITARVASTAIAAAGITDVVTRDVATTARFRAARAFLLAVAAAATAGAAEVEVRVSRRGFEPASLTLRKGETARMVLASGDGVEHCFAVDGLRVEKRIRPGGKTRFDLTPERVGVFAVHCCLDGSGGDHREQAELTVVE